MDSTVNKQKNSKLHLSKKDDMFLNSKMSFGPFENSKVNQDSSKGSIKDFV